VTFLLVNFMQMLGGARITDGESHWPGRVAINVGPWMVTFDSRPDLRDVVASMRERGGHAVTHTGKLARRDGRPFAFARSEQFLTCLTWCLWFCRGSAASVFLPVGFDKDNRAIWSRWAAHHTDPLLLALVRRGIRSQTHAVPALAAATAVGTSSADSRAWADVAGTRLQSSL
jgi:hypothetical protein